MRPQGAARVKRAAEGRWVQLLDSLAGDALAPALQKLGRHVPCPVHGGRDGFRLFADVARSGGGICNSCGAFHDGLDLLRWVRGWSFPDTVAMLAAELGLQGPAPPLLPAPPVIRPVSPADPEKVAAALARLRRLWDASLPLWHPEASLARLYFKKRGLDGPPILEAADLRLHPRLPWRDDEGQLHGVFPCLLALVRDGSGRALTLHRTWLSLDGFKAPVSKPRKLMPAPPDRKIRDVGNAAVRLWPANSVLGIGEGIETMLAVRMATGMPVWAGISATIMAGVRPPSVVRQVVVWADRDPDGAGLLWAKKLQLRLWSHGTRALVRIPGPEHGASADWNDVWRAQGSHGFPRLGSDRDRSSREGEAVP